LGNRASRQNALDSFGFCQAIENIRYIFLAQYFGKAVNATAPRGFAGNRGFNPQSYPQIVWAIFAAAINTEDGPGEAILRRACPSVRWQKC
jgi:hypothetical protein